MLLKGRWLLGDLFETWLLGLPGLGTHIPAATRLEASCLPLGIGRQLRAWGLGAWASIECCLPSLLLC